MTLNWPMSLVSTPPDTSDEPYALLAELGAQLDLGALAGPLSERLCTALRCEAVGLAVVKADGLHLVATSDDRAETSPLHGKAVDALCVTLSRGELADVNPDDLGIRQNVPLGRYESAVALPLFVGPTWVGALLACPPPAPEVLADRFHVINAAAILIGNARRYTQTVQSLNRRLHELDILAQLDRELSERLSLEHVLAQTLDWAVRYTAAHAAFLALYDPATDSLRLESQLGYRDTADLAHAVHSDIQSGAVEAARASHAVIIEDAAPGQKLYLNKARAQLTVPIRNEDRVSAVLVVESRRAHSLTAEHASFVEQLAVRAGVALENARLFAETEAEREKLSLILASIGDPVVVLDHQDRIVLLNGAAREAFRLTAGENVTGQVLVEAFAGTAIARVLADAAHSETLPYQEIRMPDDREYYALLTRHPAIGAILVLHDLAALKKTEVLKNELLSTISHDLKQPLTVMTGYLELLQMFQKLEPRSLHYVDMLQNAVRSMRTLIDDILNLARIESGMHVEVVPLRLEDLVSHVLEDLRPLASTKAITVQASTFRTVPPVLADPALANTILSNLVGNAVKYTPPEGKIQITGEVQDDRVLVSVSDNGIGIGPADQARIFDRFYRVRRAETIHIEGTGLGLAIVKRLVELHGGTISLRSAVGQGSTFTFSLPLANPSIRPF